MLAVTNQAASAIDNIIAAREGMSDEAGVRIKTEIGTSESGVPEQALSLQVVEAPEAGDEVLEEVPVFLEPEAAALLDDKLLDADLSSDQVRFALKDQS